MKKSIISAVALLTLASGCTGGGSGGGTGVVYDYYTTPGISSSSFVNALNDVDGAPSYDESEIILYTNETIRSTYAGEDDWFVIWDSEYGEYKAVSLQYLRAITYYDYYSNSYGTAEGFRATETDDILNGLTNGDFWGDDYETATFLGNDAFGIPTFRGQVSGLLYEDEEETNDVSLLAGEADLKNKIQKASNISYLYSVDFKTSMALVSLGEKVEKKLGSNAGEITLEDQKELMKDITHLTGVTLDDMTSVALGTADKEEMIKNAADKIGTSSSSLQQRMLPELFGINL
jgi:hypothetical protein